MYYEPLYFLKIFIGFYQYWGSHFYKIVSCKRKKCFNETQIESFQKLFYNLYRKCKQYWKVRRQIRPNSDHFWANGLTSVRLKKIRSEWQQCISPHTLVRYFFCLEENKDQLLINRPSIKQVSILYKSTKISIYFTYFLGEDNTHYGLGAIVAQKNLN